METFGIGTTPFVACVEARLRMSSVSQVDTFIPLLPEADRKGHGAVNSARSCQDTAAAAAAAVVCGRWRRRIEAPLQSAWGPISIWISSESSQRPVPHRAAGLVC